MPGAVLVDMVPQVGNGGHKIGVGALAIMAVQQIIRRAIVGALGQPAPLDATLVAVLDHPLAISL